MGFNPNDDKYKHKGGTVKIMGKGPRPLWIKDFRYGTTKSYGDPKLTLMCVDILPSSPTYLDSWLYETCVLVEKDWGLRKLARIVQSIESTHNRESDPVEYDGAPPNDPGLWGRWANENLLGFCFYGQVKYDKNDKGYDTPVLHYPIESGVPAEIQAELRRKHDPAGEGGFLTPELPIRDDEYGAQHSSGPSPVNADDIPYSPEDDDVPF